jgi:hypothetical protein
MPKVVVAQGNDSSQAIRMAIESLGFEFVDLVKGAKSICIVSTASRDATQTVIDAILFHCRTPIHVLGPDDEAEVIEATIAREISPSLPGRESEGGAQEGFGILRMPIRRPRAIMNADVVIALAPMLADKDRRTMLSIEQYLFQTWYVPERRTPNGFIRTHAPWLEGELRDVVLADLYAQRPVTLAFVDGTATAGVVLAGFDAVAVDSVAVHMHGVMSEDVGYLRSLAEQNIGVCTLSKIDVPLGIISR